MVISRLTDAAKEVLKDIAAEPQCGADLMRSHRIQSGTLYPMLHRFECNGLVRSTKEKGDPARLGRPLRKTYRITAAGRQLLKKLNGK